MRRPLGICLSLTIVLMTVGPLLAAADGPPKLAEETLDGQIVTPAGVFDSWADYIASDYFQDRGGRCGVTVEPPSLSFPELGGGGGTPSDCSYGANDPDPVYDPSVARYRIPVVVHVIMNTSVAGFISEGTVQDQIEILNEDFLAITGTNGANGTDVAIEFYLATRDPQGNPTNGITYSTNNTWFNDGGSYWNTLAWDTNVYANIYTNTAGGNLGYVPDLPQGGIAGSNADRVVCLWNAFGRNAPIGPPYNQGRTVTHEVGHYLGLYHTFSGGCGSATACYTSGDRVCDTNPESGSRFGCPGGQTSCGSTDPIHNYMDYTDDLCMEEFTPEQARRIRCSLEHYRSNLYLPALCGNNVIDDGEECDDGNNVSGDGCDAACFAELPPTEVSAPGSPEPFIFTGKKTMIWEDAAGNGVVAYNLYRGTLSDLRSAGDYGFCMQSGLPNPSATHPFKPPVGSAYFYVVTGENSFGEGTLGYVSGGDERANTAACP